MGGSPVVDAENRGKGGEEATRRGQAGGNIHVAEWVGCKGSGSRHHGQAVDRVRAPTPQNKKKKKRET